MIRMIGILLVIGGTVGAGLLYATALKAEIRRFEGFLKLARLIRSRIECFRQPLASIYGDFEDEALEDCGFAKALRQGDFLLALAKTKDTLGLRPALIDLLSEFGSELGKSHAEDQLRHCDRCIGQMTDALAALRAESADRIRLSHALSLALAAMVTILLL